MVRQIPKTVGALILAFLAAQPLLGQRLSHYSSFSDRPDLYRKAIAQAPGRLVPELRGKEIRYGIVTHHLLASRLIVQYFRGLAQTAHPKRIVLLGPDHSRRGLGAISLSGIPWQTPFGTLGADTDAIARLSEKLRLQPDPGAFSNEHSIGVLVPFIKYFFPDARLVPILIRGGAGRETLDSLCRTLAGMNDGETHFLLSSDFSHGKKPAEASLQDLESARVIAGQSFEDVWKLDHDCRAGLYVLLKLSAGAVPWISEHTNPTLTTGPQILKKRDRAAL
jgi:AmmeMemoRadiSam system protein B